MKKFSKLQSSKVALVAMSALLLTLAGCSDNLEGTGDASKDLNKVEISKEGEEDTTLEPTPEKDAREEDARETDARDKDAREEDNTDEVKNEVDNEVDKIVSFEKDANGITFLLTYHVDKNGIVVKQDTNNSISYDAMGAESADMAKEMMESIEEEFLDIPGLTYELDYQSDRVVETISVDYRKADVLDLVDLPGSDFTENINDQTSKIEISFLESAKLLEAQGFTEIE